MMLLRKDGLDVIANPNGDVVLSVFQNDVGAHPLGTAPDWQPVNGMPPFIDDRLVQKLTYTYELAGPAQILGFARRKHVGRVLSTVIDQHPSGLVMHRFGPLQVLGGMMVAPACGYPPLRS